jgi:tetratricopeptide (TPR) repeat protein
MNLVNDAIAKPSYYKSAQGKPFAQHKTFAQSSVEIATIHYHAGRWNDAIGALEHAYSCYLKIGADTECTRGVIDVARRLARVHLRAGQLNDASFWLIRAQWMFHQRSEVRPNGLQLRYRLRDRFLEAQLNQVLTQLELTNAIYRFEEDIPDADDATQKLHDFVKQPYRTADDQMSNQSRLEEAERAFNLTVRIGERRLLPEAQIHTIRLQTLANEGPDGKQLEKLVTWFKTESLSYQFDLLQLQLETFMAPEMGIFMHFGENEAESLAEDLSPNVRGQLLLRWQHRKEYTQRFYGAARKMWDKHGNRYWYARGLCACFLVARDAGHPQTWIDGLRSGLESAAIEIKRPDWIEKTYSYLETNAGFWLLGY